MRPLIYSCSLLAISAFAQESRPSATLFWTAKTGSLTLTWTATDLSAASTDGSPVFSTRALAKQGFETYKESMRDDRVGLCTYTRKFQPIDLVGNLLTFRDELETSCESEAHPSFASRLTTVDLSRPSLQYSPSPENDFSIEPGKGVETLTNIFPESEVLKKLNADPLLKKTLSSVAQSLGELTADVGDDGIAVAGRPCKFHLAPDYLSRFAFHNMEGKQVAVRLQLTPTGGACRSTTADLGLLLAVPPSLQSALVKAAKGSAGFLASNQPQKKVFTVITFSMETGRPK